MIRCIPGIDVLYLLHTAGGESQASAEHIKGWIESFIPDVRLRVIPFSDFMGIVQVIYDIYDEMKGKNVEFSINITGGTNLITAAACYSSYYIRAQIYYSLRGDDGTPIEKQVIRVDAPKAIDVDKYKDLTKDILRYILDKRNEDCQVTKTMIANAFDITKQKVGYHTNILENDGLIQQAEYKVDGRVDNRRSELVMTPQGVMVARNLKRRAGPIPTSSIFGAISRLLRMRVPKEPGRAVVC